MADKNDSIFGGLLNDLANLNPDKQKGVKKGVIVDKDSGDKSVRINPALNSQEKKRYENIFNIFKNVVFPGEEAKRASEDKEAKQSQIDQVTNNAGSSKNKSSMSMGKMGALGMLAGVLAASKPTRDGLEGIVKVLKALKSIGLLFKSGGMLKGLKSLGAFLKNSKLGTMFTKYFSQLMTTLRGLKSTLMSSKLGKSISSAVKGVGGMMKGFKAIFGGIGKVFGAVTKPIAKIGAALFKGTGFLLKSVGKIGKVLGPKLKFIPIIGSIFNFMTAWEAFGNGNIGRGIWELISGVAGLIPGAGTLVSGLMDGASLLYDLMSDSEEGAGIRELTKGTGTKLKEFFGGIGTKIFKIFSGIGDWIVGLSDTLLAPVKAAISMIPGMGDFFDEAEDLPASSRVTAQLSNHAQMDAISDRVGRDVYMEAMRQSTPDRKAWLAKQGYVQAPSAQDAIVSGGKVTRLDNADQAIALKAGGAIDRMLKDRSGAINVDEAELFNVMKDVGKQQLKNLIEMNKKLSQIVLNTTPIPEGGEVSLYTNPMWKEYVQ
tara:strand:+ start:1489 stop:3117 length:1629 start_codon:yes stop_codon:yes gene_type:complete